MPFNTDHDIWGNFLFISSAETSQQFLLNRYEKASIENANKKSFDNSYSFIYYLEQGRDFFKQAQQSPVSIQPILLFYGLVFQIKACILLVDPNYPESTSVLAHGVSTRKRKKHNYMYLDDEVKIQKNGLFPHFSDKMFHMKQLEGDKYSIQHLLKEVPELSDYFMKWDGGIYSYKLEEKDDMIFLPDCMLDHYKMTHMRLFEYIKSKTNHPNIFYKNEEITYFSLKSHKVPIEVLPFRFNFDNKHYYFIKNHVKLSFQHELMIHYLLLYHLSMIARYEIEWWSELIHQKHGVEYPIILQYLNIALRKCPFLIYQYMFA